MKICNNCKTKNDDAAKFCRSCGKLLDVQEELASTKTESTNSGSSSIVTTIIIYIVVLAGCVFAISCGAPRILTIAIGATCASGLTKALKN